MKRINGGRRHTFFITPERTDRGRSSSRRSLSYQCGDLEDAMLSVIEPLENLKTCGPEEAKAVVRDFKAGAATLETMMKKMSYLLGVMLEELIKDDNGGRESSSGRRRRSSRGEVGDYPLKRSSRRE
jgi:hypothetical protein